MLLLEGVATHQQGHLARVVGEEQRGLSRGIAGADQVDVHALRRTASLRAAP
jgi:hypothetical protein